MGIVGLHESLPSSLCLCKIFYGYVCVFLVILANEFCTFIVYGKARRIKSSFFLEWVLPPFALVDNRSRVYGAFWIQVQQVVPSIGIYGPDPRVESMWIVSMD